ncbi:MAG TPA: Gfo/Idh/MocA family oxidoreductase [Bacillales bacterium]|nr:Gfo/Idh/MocA family oxidoreductase [Bacillales bacterium]
MVKRVRWGVLGNANIARKALVPAIKAAENAELKGIASRNSDRAAEAAAEQGFEKHYGSYEALLADPEIDAVYIPLPNGLHAEWVKKAAEAGKHVLCEKPAALTADEATGMIEECGRHEVLFMEAFMYQFHPQHDRVKEIIADGEIGDVRVMRSQFSFGMKDPANVRLNRELGGGSLYDVGCYCIHAARHILGEEPSRVYAQAHLDADFDHVDMTTTGMLSFEKDVQLLFDCSFESFPQENYQVIGEKGSIEVVRPFRPDKNEDGKAHIYITSEDGTTREEPIPGDAYTLQVEHFSQCVLDGAEPSYSGVQTIRNMRVIDACYESIRTGEVVELRK